jgi:hypothetical protein
MGELPTLDFKPSSSFLKEESHFLNLKIKSKVIWTLKALYKKGNPFEKNRKGKQWKRGEKKTF